MVPRPDGRGSDRWTSFAYAALCYPKLMSASGKPLKNCPVCVYPLTGWPRTCCCPECGFEYDESMIAWVGSSLDWRKRRKFTGPRRKFVIAWAIVMLSSYYIAVIEMVPVLWNVQFLSVGVAQWILSILPVVIGFFVLLGRRSPPFIVVGDDGIVCRANDATVRRLSWSQIWLEADSWRIYSLDGGKHEEECFPREQLGTKRLGKVHREIKKRWTKATGMQPGDPIPQSEQLAVGSSDSSPEEA